MSRITRRQTVRMLLGGAAASLVVGGVGTAARADVGLTLDRTVTLRLNVEASLTKDYGKVKFILYREHPVTKRNERVLMWGPFMNTRGYTKAARLGPGTYTFASTGTAVQYTAVIETRPTVKPEGEQEPEYQEVGRLSGSYP